MTINAILDVHLDEPIKLQIFNKNYKVRLFYKFELPVLN